MIKSERLLLRQWKEADCEPFAALNADPRVREFFPSTLTREESDALVDLYSKRIEDKGWGFWAVVCPGVADFVGMIGIEEVGYETPFTPAVEIGWRLAHEYWGQGYATEGARAAMDFAFSELGLEELVAFTALPNQRSMQVMERLGMSRKPDDDFDHPAVPEGHPLRRHALYRMQRNDWYT